MAERLDLFSTPVLKVRPGDDIVQADELAAIIRAHRSQHDGVQRSNIGGWHSAPDMTDWGGDPARSLAAFGVQQVGAHMADTAPGGKRKFDWAIDMWANVNGPGAANQLHCHPGAFWSGVYYADPGTAASEGAGGELLLEDPRYPLAFMTVPDLVFRYPDHEPMHSQFAIRPERGLLVLFPSWLRHSVRPYHGEGERISVAMNFSLADARPA